MSEKQSKIEWVFEENNFFIILFILGFVILLVGFWFDFWKVGLGWIIVLVTYQTLKD